MYFSSDAKDSEFLHKMTYLHKLIEFIAVTQGQIPAQIVDFGHYIKQYDGAGFLGGNISAISTDPLGRIHSSTIQVSSLLGCGHTVERMSQVSGYCQACGCVCCNIHPSCLRVCELSGITVCRRHYTIKNNIVVSTFAQRGFWQLKVRKLAKQKELAYAGNNLPDKK